MLDRRPRIVLFCGLALWIGCGSGAVSGDPDEVPGSDPLARISRTELLARFDIDGDGELNGIERSRLREAFGSHDVPMLPDSPFNYVSIEFPRHFKATQLDREDNTPADNPLSNHGATLGRVLFYDRQLSRNNTISCASCHEQERGFADPRRFSIGFEGGHTKRNAMGLANIRYTNLNGRRPGFFWDERAPTLEAQALMPIQDEVEMGMDLDSLEQKLQTLPYYPPLFVAAFGSSSITSERIAKALAQFMRSMVSVDSKFDRGAAAAGNGSVFSDFANFTADENQGKSLFFEGPGGLAEFGCARCHLPPSFNMEKAQNIGLDLVYEDLGLGNLDRSSNDPFTPSDDGKFKASSLRNIELMAPYMHDGRFLSLEDVIEHYSSGVKPHENLALAVEESEREDGVSKSGLQFTETEKAALVAFLKTLTDEAFLTDPRFSDPFIRGPTNENDESVGR